MRRKGPMIALALLALAQLVLGAALWQASSARETALAALQARMQELQAAFSRVAAARAGGNPGQIRLAEAEHRRQVDALGRASEPLGNLNTAGQALVWLQISLAAGWLVAVAAWWLGRRPERA